MNKTNLRERANLDWANLPFGYVKTDYNIRFFYKNGSWDNGELHADETMPVHIAAPCLHYGQECFEGMKVFETVDGRIAAFRPVENAKRLNRSGSRIFIPEIPEALFIGALDRLIKANLKYVPPFGTGASLYVRPLAIGIGARVGLGPADEYAFVMFVSPVGPYYKGGFIPVRGLILEDFDRAAPNGVGDCKVGGNYAAGLMGGQYGKSKGYPIVLYLDSAQKKYVDEFGTSNFIGIKGNVYVTPRSQSILPSITNDSLAIIAADMGMKVERRPVSVDELDEFDEVGAVGTAAVITPVNQLDYKGKTLTFGSGDKAGPVMTELYNRLTKIQTGDREDTFGWLHEIKA